MTETGRPAPGGSVQTACQLVSRAELATSLRRQRVAEGREGDGDGAASGGAQASAFPRLASCLCCQQGHPAEAQGVASHPVL